MRWKVEVCGHPFDLEGLLIAVERAGCHMLRNRQCIRCEPGQSFGLLAKNA